MIGRPPRTPWRVQREFRNLPDLEGRLQRAVRVLLEAPQDAEQKEARGLAGLTGRGGVDVTPIREGATDA